MSQAKEKLDAINARLVGLFKADRQTMTAFKALSESAARPGRLSPALKEMAAMAIAVATKCDDCVIYHTAAAKKHGASRDEFCEMLALAVEMAGGPGAVYASKALQVFDELG